MLTASTRRPIISGGKLILYEHRSKQCFFFFVHQLFGCPPTVLIDTQHIDLISFYKTLERSEMGLLCWKALYRTMKEGLFRMRKATPEKKV